MFDPPPFNPELPCELIAENTFEALRIVRQGDWVYKFLRPHDSFPGQTAEERRRQILLRVRESQRHEELNPLKYEDRSIALVSRFVTGRDGSTSDFRLMTRIMHKTRRGFISDLGPSNLIVTQSGNRIAIDFTIDWHHPDWATIQLDSQPIT
jgi:hypothetical protein